MKIVTGYKGEPHITSAQDRAWHQGIFGAGSYVLNIGQKLAGEIVTANEIRIMDGAISHQGCIAVIGHGTYDTLEIANGEQGKKRIDLVVARYSIDTETGEENLDLVVIEGTSTTGTPVAPSFTTGNIQAGDSPVDMPLYNVNIDGIAITSLTPRFTTIGTRVDTNNSVTDMGNTKVSKTGDTMTGTLFQNGTSLDTSVTPSANAYYVALRTRDKNNKTMGGVTAWIDSTDAIGTTFEGARVVNGEGKYNSLRLLVDASGNCKVIVSGTNAPAAWRSAINAVNKAGDTMTGALTIKHNQTNFPGYKLQHDGIQIGTRPSESKYASYVISDKAGERIGQMETAQYTDGSIENSIAVRNNVNGTATYKKFGIKLATDGTVSYTLASPEALRSAIGAAPTSHASSANTYGLGSTSNYGHVKTINGLTQSSHSDGTALSAYQGKVLNDKITALTNKVVFERIVVSDIPIGTVGKISNVTGTYTIPTSVLASTKKAIAIAGWGMGTAFLIPNNISITADNKIYYKIVNWNANTDQTDAKISVTILAVPK